MAGTVTEEVDFNRDKIQCQGKREEFCFCFLLFFLSVVYNSGAVP